ncbi:hypothetical protein [Lederbergia lenta]|uniref:hypothetical protein n=1 Tax=Lederbergia lenta TaxID=1467 RepID=UPI00203B47ED|nr:hypothetical protein [Lederbergia lenta]MCM3109921.1 hypothetical protein [Lederbergia lenta]
MTESKFGYFPKTKEDFDSYIESLESQPHDYNTIAEALVDSTLAFFNYFASKHGMTGFQSSWAALNFLGRTRGMEAPFMIVDSSKMLYPQYDLIKDVEKFLEESKPKLAEMAKKNLGEVDKYTSEKVIKRWNELAK